jgi:hypothetical protein
MKKLLDMTGKVYDAATAAKVAGELQESDPEWNYGVELSEDGKHGRVMVYDENFEFLGVF